jgi:hypothetical protein
MGEPRAIAPSNHCTVPVAKDDRGAVKVVDNVTDCPNVDGFTDDVALRVEVALLTTWVNVVVD